MNIPKLNRNQLIGIVVGGIIIGLFLRSRNKTQDVVTTQQEDNSVAGADQISTAASPVPYDAYGSSAGDVPVSIYQPYPDFPSYPDYPAAVDLTTADGNAAVDPPPAAPVPIVITVRSGNDPPIGKGGGAPNGRTAPAHKPVKTKPARRPHQQTRMEKGKKEWWWNGHWHSKPNPKGGGEG